MPLFQALSLNYIKHILQKMSSYAMHFPIDLRIESRCAAHHGDLRRLLAWESSPGWHVIPAFQILLPHRATPGRCCQTYPQAKVEKEEHVESHVDL